ncbi:MAG: PorT family protein [Chitinophagaceae bacterium]|nr:PorT family protein [Chitinophagaceae bacterium]MBL0272410.1 PorT family protein [Chitinophagaceae bacterium]
MKRLIIILLLLSPVLLNAQLRIGVKAGLNFANVTNASEIKAGNRTGYMIGGYIAPKPKKMFGFRSEIILSRQGYDYKTSSSGKVNLDYLLLPQLITLNFGKKIQLHAGGQMAFLLNASVDSTGSGSGSLFDYFNRFDYGLAAGAEIYPFMGFFIGGRINISFNDISVGGIRPNFIPDINAKNNVVQLYAGWRF